MLIVLDLDETIVHSRKYDEEGFNQDTLEYIDMDGHFRVFFRPYFRVLLNILFKYYDVAVWSAGSEQYVLAIVDELQKKIKKKFKFVWTLNECKESIDKYKVTKALEMIPEYPHVYIIEDNSEIKEKYPDNTIKIKPYSAPVYDEEILKITALLYDNNFPDSIPTSSRSSASSSDE